ncbi:MAG: glycosyl hydrolase [Candidatus Paceibacterota bacterium]|jgi:hypothetical protein
MNKKSVVLLVLLLMMAFSAILFLVSRDSSINNISAADNPSLSFLQYYAKPGSFKISGIRSICSNGVPQITVSWSASKGSVSYTLQRKDPLSSSWKEMTETGNTGYTDLAFFPGYSAGNYEYRVQAKNKYGTRNSSSLEFAVTRCPAPVPAPSEASVKWGVYLPGSLSEFESQVGKEADMQAVFVGWGDDGEFPSEYEGELARKEKTLVVFWEPTVNYDAIVSGKWDGYIRSFSDSAKSYGGPVILAPFHEMNGNWDVWDGTVNGNTPQKFIGGWRYVHKFFDGVSNVKFGWAVNNESVPDTAENAIGAYYPGDEYVDYIGVDGFNFGDPWQSFSEVFDRALSDVSAYRKPVYIFSMACASGPKKADWIKDAFAVQVPKHPEVAGWIWFNENKEENWLVSSDEASLSAFKDILP